MASRSHFRHTTLGRTALDEWSARRRDLYLTTHNTHNRQTSMPTAGFEPPILVSERPKTHALDRTATGIGVNSHCCVLNICGEYTRAETADMNTFSVMLTAMRFLRVLSTSTRFPVAEFRTKKSILISIECVGKEELCAYTVAGASNTENVTLNCAQRQSLK
jgi:hypothetical protein